MRKRASSHSHSQSRPKPSPASRLRAPSPAAAFRPPPTKQMMQTRSQGLLAMARRSLSISVGSIGVPPLLAPGGGSRRQLHILPQGQRVWVSESFNGASGFGLNAERFFVGSELEDVFEFFKKNPFLHAVPYDRLFSPHVTYPHFVKDDGNKFILSGIHLIGGAHDLGLSTKGLFTRENTVLLPRRMVLGLKEINATGVIVPGGATQLTTKERAENYKEFVSFFEYLILKSQGPVPKHFVPPFLGGLMLLANEMLSDERIVEIIQSYPPLMPLQHKAVFYRRAFNIHERIDLVVRHGLPGAGLVASGKTDDVKVLQMKLLNSVPYTVGPDLWGDMALSNIEVFNIFMSISALKKNDAEGLTRMLRVMVSHPFGLKVVNLMQELQQVENDAKAGRRLNRRAKYLAVRACSSTLQTIPPACREVIRLADQTYPEYPTAVAIGFWKSGAYGLLDMPGLMRSL